MRDWMKKVKGLGQKERKRKKQLVDTDKSIMITEGEGGWMETEASKGGINGDGSRFYLVLWKKQ